MYYKQRIKLLREKGKENQVEHDLLKIVDKVRTVLCIDDRVKAIDIMTSGDAKEAGRMFDAFMMSLCELKVQLDLYSDDNAIFKKYMETTLKKQFLKKGLKWLEKV